MAALPIVLGVVGFTLVFLVIVLGYRARKRRIQEWQQTAGHLGFTYSTEDPFDLLSLPFDLFRRGDGRGVENVVWGQKDGLDIKAFEYWYYEDQTDSEGHTSRDYSHFSCTVVPTVAVCPHTTIGPEGLFSRLGRALGFHDIEFESEEFNKAMKVHSSDPKFATYLVDARMMQWLLDNKRWQFEVCDRWVLAYDRRMKPMLIWNVIEAAREFQQHIPKVIDETYGEAR